KVFAEGQETPTGNSVSGVSNNQEVQDGQNYSSTFTFYNLNIEYPSYSNNDSIFQGTAGNKLVIDLSSAKELIVGKSMSNDLSSTFWYANQIRQYRNTSPEFSVFQVDQYNAIQYLTGGNFDAMNFSTQNNFSDTIEMPNDDLYFVIRNNNHNNYIQLDGNISVEDAGNNTISTLEPNVEGGSVLGITTVNKINSNEIKIYPNPANKHLIVEAENMHELTLYNIAGMLIYSSKTNSSKTVIDLKDFAKGVYIIKITSDDNIYSEKIIISN
ncbi:MAG: T9SS type A sorting domain-containing protein, partial [Bacteroidota bacterium]|nr:T9SS type A sorting domain-containing protein [Bacteroidota bacterium]